VKELKKDVGQEVVLVSSQKYLKLQDSPFQEFYFPPKKMKISLAVNLKEDYQIQLTAKLVEKTIPLNNKAGYDSQKVILLKITDDLR
jgi:hypothetical protein